VKKFFLFFVLFAIIAAGTVFSDSFSFGTELGYSSGLGFAVTFRFPVVPIYWAINYNIWEDDSLWIGLTGDYHLYGGRLLTDLYWYLRAGFFVNYGLSNDDGFAVGARLPIGIKWLLDSFEFYLQVVPNIGMYVPNIDLYPNFWGAGLGVRLWF